MATDEGFGLEGTPKPKIQRDPSPPKRETLYVVRRCTLLRPFLLLLRMPLGTSLCLSGEGPLLRVGTESADTNKNTSQPRTTKHGGLRPVQQSFRSPTSCLTPILCYAIMLPGQKPVFRTGFRSDSIRENIKKGGRCRGFPD